MDYIKQLLFEIAHCNAVTDSRINGNHPCSTIINSQTGNAFQLPEPWNGRLDSARILFVSSNPSYDEKELFPTSDWDNFKVEEFFTYRYDDLQYARTPYYSTMKKYAGWILNTPIQQVNPYRDFCITEIVHCKSRNEFGVKKCREYCIEKWMNQILDCFTGEYIVVVGKTAQECFHYTAQNKKIIKVPHPQARGYTDEKRKRIIQEQLFT